MSAELSFRPPGFEQLNRRRLEIWPDRSDDQMALRMRRATSWLERAELALAAKVQEGYDSACIFYWISLNAAYAQDIPVNLVRGKKWTDSDGFKKFADKVVERDPEQSLAKLIFEHLREDILRLTEDVYLFKDFWLARNGTLSGQGWKSPVQERKQYGQAVSDDRGLQGCTRCLTFDLRSALRPPKSVDSRWGDLERLGEPESSRTWRQDYVVSGAYPCLNYA